MSPTTDPTTNSSLRSWVESANDPASDFPIQNLPWCVFSHPEDGGDVLGVRIGESVVDCATLHDAGLLGDEEHHDHAVCDALVEPDLMMFAALPRGTRAGLRAQVQRFLLEGSGGGQRARRLRDKAVFEVSGVEMRAPVAPVPNYTDFYASVHHATNVGSMFRPTSPLLPNYKHIPIGYHGRASSIVVSGTGVPRPSGQHAPAEEGGAPTFGPCRMLDYELEIGAFVAGGNDLGTPIPLARAEDHILGLVLLNDWSARDLQKWEYQPLGPFLAKSFATTVSPYVITLEALAPFRCPAFARPGGDPRPLAYLADEENERSGGLDLTLEVWLASAQMRERGMGAVRLSRGSFSEMYWTIAQMLTHHASNGCNMQPGDLLGSGTVSGATPESRGSLLERSWNGDPFATPPKLVPGSDRTPIRLPTGETRVFLEDGDEVTLRGWCERPGFRRIGFGECTGVVVAGVPVP